MRKMALTLAILAVPAMASAETSPWRVTEISGDVRLVEGGQTRVALRNALLVSGAAIVTGPKGKAVIVRGEEFVVISPNSRLRVPAAEKSSGIMQLIEDFGTALFKIKKKTTPHFGVQTPYLAAVVKGTTFTVTVGSEGGSVQVTEGAVEVSTLDGGAADLITPGVVASVGASDLFQLSVQGDSVKTLRSEAAPAAGTVTSSAVPAPAPIFQGPVSEPAQISAPIGENEQSLAAVTTGLLEGEAAVEVAMLRGSQNESGRGDRPNSGSSGIGQEDDKPGNGGSPGNDQGNQAGGGGQPGQGSAGNDQGNGTGGQGGENSGPGNPGNQADEGGSESGPVDVVINDGRDDQGSGGSGSSGDSDDGDQSGEGDGSGGSDDGDQSGQGDDSGAGNGNADSSGPSDTSGSGDGSGIDNDGGADDSSGDDDAGDNESEDDDSADDTGDDETGSDDNSGTDDQSEQGGSGDGGNDQGSGQDDGLNICVAGVICLGLGGR